MVKTVFRGHGSDEEPRLRRLAAVSMRLKDLWQYCAMPADR